MNKKKPQLTNATENNTSHKNGVFLAVITDTVYVSIFSGSSQTEFSPGMMAAVIVVGGIMVMAIMGVIVLSVLIHRKR